MAVGVGNIMRVLSKYWFIGALILAFWVVLILGPVAFNGCGEAYDAEDCITARVEHVGRIVDLQFRVQDLESVPTYQDGLDTVDWEEVYVWPYFWCSDSMKTEGWLVYYSAIDGLPYWCRKEERRLVRDSFTVWQPITEPIMKPLVQVWLKPDELKKLIELITPNEDSL